MRRWLTAAGAGLLVACASAAPPPGGPEDPAPPRLLRTSPDTNAVNVTDRVVSFHFDETINDRGSGAQELTNFFLVSPSDGSARISYRRSRIDVRPRLGFRPNTAYTVTLLPGLGDLRGNVMKEGGSVVFSTGPTIPTLRIAGTVFDWSAERPASRALVQAITPDSVIYLAQSDTGGRFDVGPLPAGTYLLRAIADANGNRGLDRNEAFDTLRVTPPLASPVEVRMLVRDTLAPRLLTVAVNDSVSLRATFDRALDPAALPAPSAFRVAGPDSVAIAVAAVLTPTQEAAEALAVTAARADSVRLADSLAGRPRPPATAPPRAATPAARRPSIPAPPTVLLLRLARPVAAGATYRVTITGARALSGRSATSERTFTVARADAARPATDTTGSAPAPARPAPTRTLPGRP